MVPLIGRRRLGWIGVGGVALLLAAFAVLHAPPVRARVLVWVLARSSSAGVTVGAEHLDYNLFTLSARVRGLTVAVNGAAAQPFFSAEEVRLAGGRRALFGLVDFAHVEVVRPRVVLVRDASGAQNWPVSSSDAVRAAPINVHIERLQLTGLEVSWHDARADSAVEAHDLSLDLAATGGETAGPLHLAGPMRVRWRDRETSVRSLDGRLSWNDRDLSIDRLRADLPEGALRIDARVDALLGAPRFDLLATTDIVLAAIGPWLRVDSGLKGVLHAVAHVTGPSSAVQTKLTVAARDLSVAGSRPITVDATARVSGDAAEITTLTARVADGSLTGRGRASLGRGPGSMSLSWQQLDLATLLEPFLGSSMTIRPAARLNGSLEASWATPRLEAVTLRGESRMRARDDASTASAIRNPRSAIRNPRSAIRSDLPLDGSIALDLQGRRWTLRADQTIDGSARVSGEVGGILDTRDLWRSTLAGAFHTAAVDLARLSRTLGRAGLGGISSTLGGEAQAGVTLTGTLGAARMEGTVDAHDVQYATLRGVAVHTRIAVTRAEVQLDQLEVRLGENTARGRARLVPGSGRLDVEFDALLGNVAMLSSALPAVVDPEGSLEITGNVSGSWTTPRVAAHLTTAGLTAAGQRADRLEGDVSVDGRTIFIDHVRIESEGGRLDARGSLDLTNRAYVVHAAADRWPLRDSGSERSSRLRSQENPASFGEARRSAGGAKAADRPGTSFAARVSGEVDGDGTFENLGGRGRLSFADAVWADLGPIDAAVSAAGRDVTATVRAPDLALQATGSAGIDPGGTLSIHARWEPGDLAKIVRRLGWSPPFPVSGSAALAVDLTSRRGAADGVQAVSPLNVAVALDALQLDIDDQAVRLKQPATIEYDGTADAAKVSNVILGAGSSTLSIAGALGGPAASGFAATLEGSLADFAFLRRFVEPNAGATGSSTELMPSGTIDVRLNATGPLRRPIVSGVLRLADGRLPLTATASITNLSAAARYEAGVLILDSFSGALQGATLVASGRTPASFVLDGIPARWREWVPAADGPAQLRAQVLSITPQVVAPFIDASTLEAIGGHVDLSVELQADRPALEDLRGSVTLSRAELSISGVSFDQQKPTRLLLGDGRLDIADWLWGTGDHRVTLTGGATLAANPVLGITATSTVDLRLLSVFTRSASFGGRADTELRVGGTLDSPTLDGYITFGNGELRFVNPRVIVSDLTGTITLARDAVTFERIWAGVNGGEAEVSGSVRHRWFTPLDGEVMLRSRGSAVDLYGLRAEADSDLTFRIERRGPIVSGTVSLTRSAYREPLSLTGGLLQALQASSRAIQARTSTPLDPLRLDVRVLTQDDLLVDNNYARLAVSADVRLVGTVGQPGLTGRAMLAEGGLAFFSGNRYRLGDQGSIDFSNANAIEPNLNIRAVTRVGDTEITLTLKGTPATLETSLTSDDPQKSQSDLVSLLVTGRTAAEVGSAGLASGSGELLGYLSGELVGAAGRALGLDTIRVERGQYDLRFDAGLVATETDPGSRLTVGKTLGRNVQVVFSQSLRQSGGLTWIVSYAPRSNIEVRMVTLDDGDRIYNVQHDLLFGASKPAVPRVSSPPAPGVRSIRISGAASDEAALRSQLKLAGGDRFSFFRWQDDRERLEAWYRKRDRLTAHVTTRRVAAEVSGVAGTEISYDVQPGPHTTIVVEGFAFPDAVLAAMKAAWTGAVVDAFVTEEVATIARADLADRGFIQASVVATLASPSPDEKRLQLTVNAGRRFGTRRIVFRGNRHVPGERLRAVIEDQQLDRAVWLDGGRARDALVTFYRRAGYLNVSVQVAAIEIAGDAATRPIDVDEGELFHLREISIEGLRTASADDVGKTSGLLRGAPFSQEAIDRARVAIGESLRKVGFNASGVTLRAGAVADRPEVDVVISVEEGSQQRLRDIVTSGATRTNPALISRALKLEIGQPVNLSEWYRARRRLYETGAFRRVDIEPEPISPDDGTAEAAPYAAPHASSSPDGGTAETAPDATAPDIGTAKAAPHVAPPDGGTAQAAPSAPPYVTEQPMRARVTLEEWVPVRLRYGLELNDQSKESSAARLLSLEPAASAGRVFGPGLASDLSMRNLFGRAVSVGLAGRYTRDFRAARAYATAPAVFGFPITSNIFVTRSREQVGGTDGARRFVTDKSGLTLEQRIRPAEKVEVAYSYAFERNHTFDLFADPEDPLVLDIPVNVARLASAAIVDMRNDRIDATRGWLLLSDLEYSPPSLGSDLRFVKYLLQQRYYRTAGPVVLATSARLGLATAFGQNLLPQERFFAGGGNSVRGYGEDELSPNDAFGPVGGNALVVLNLEVRFPVFKIVRGVSFFDAGRAFDTVGHVALTDLSSGTGAGVRIQTPIALIRVDYGVPLDRAVPRRARWFFSVGQAF